MLNSFAKWSAAGIEADFSQRYTAGCWLEVADAPEAMMSQLRLFHLPTNVPTPELEIRTVHRLTGLVPRLTSMWVAKLAARLSENRRALLAVPTEELLSALTRAAARPSDPLAVSQATGLTPEQVTAEHAHLRRLFIEPGQLRRWLSHERVGADELGRQARGPAVILHVLGGLAAYPVWVSLSAGLLARSGNLVKPTSADLVTPVFWAQQLAEADRRLGDAVAVVPWTGGDIKLEQAALGAVGLVTAYGSDTALTDLRARTPVGVRFLAHPHRFSLAVLTAGADWAEALSTLVRDVWLVDLSGCLSPTVAVVEIGPAEPGRQAERFAAELMRAFTVSGLEFPTDRPEVTAQSVRRSREVAEFAELAGCSVRLLTPRDAGWTAVIQWRTKPGGWPTGLLDRVLNVLLVSELAELETLLTRRQLSQLACVGLAGPTTEIETAIQYFADFNVSRFCGLGEMQTPPLEWNHDGRFHLHDFLSWNRTEFRLT